MLKIRSTNLICLDVVIAQEKDILLMGFCTVLPTLPESPSHRAFHNVNSEYIFASLTLGSIVGPENVGIST